MNAPAADILTRIVADRRRRIEALKQATPLHVLRERLVPRPLGRLERALRRGGPDQPLRLLCEIKRASPSRGMLRADLDPVATARLYEAGGAAAISIVTEPDHFQGDLAWIDAVRPAVELPLLLKDFVVDPWQLYDAARRGADGVLLLAALHSEVELQIRIGEARQIGLDALVEVHDEDELRRAVRAGATLIGVNNRDLRTFEVDLATAPRLIAAMPERVTALAESGLARPEDVAALRATRCDGVLMGEVFMASADPAATLARMVAAARGAA